MISRRYTRILTTAGIIFGFIALIGYQLSQFATDASLNHWHNGASGYKAALEQQKKSGKSIALFFHTDWCSSCKNLRETILSSKEFDRFAQDLIPVKINPEMSLEGQRIADKYRVIGYPTFLIISNNSSKDMRKVTPIRTRLNMAPEKFIASCKKALDT